MIKKILDKVKNLWKKLKEKIFGKPATKEQVWQGLYKWIVENRPEHLEFHCPICGSILTVKNIEEKHYTDDYITLIYKCNKKCQMNVQRRFTTDMLTEIKTSL